MEAVGAYRLQFLGPFSVSLSGVSSLARTSESSQENVSVSQRMLLKEEAKNLALFRHQCLSWHGFIRCCVEPVGLMGKRTGRREGAAAQKGPEACLTDPKISWVRHQTQGPVSCLLEGRLCHRSQEPGTEQ